MGIKKLLHNEGKTILYQNQAQPHHNTTYSKQKVGLSIKFYAYSLRVVSLQTAVHIGWPSEARIFAVDRSTFSICRWRSTIRLSSVGINRVTIIFMCGTYFICIHCIFVLNKNELPPFGTGSFPFVVCGLVSIYRFFLKCFVALC